MDNSPFPQRPFRIVTKTMTAQLSINFPADNQLQRKGAKDADEFFAQSDYRLKNTPATGSKESNQYASVAPAQSQPQETTESPLRQLANRPYLELLELANSLNFTAKEIEGFKQHLESEKEAEKKCLE